MARLRAGDLVAIPVNSRWALGKVVFVSEYFKNIMLLCIYSPLFSDLNKYENIMDGEPILNFFTASVGLKKRGWRVVGSCLVSDEEQRSRTLRIVGGEVWEKDDVLRSATSDDERAIRTMGVDGLIRVENKISEHFLKNQ